MSLTSYRTAPSRVNFCPVSEASLRLKQKTGPPVWLGPARTILTYKISMADRPKAALV